MTATAADPLTGHSYQKLDLYCPACGTQNIWKRVEPDGGDYYVGEAHLCTGCAAMFFLPGGIDIASKTQATAIELLRVANRSDR